MILRYSARAMAQLVAIHSYLEREGNPAAAKRVGASIREAAELLRHFPFAGRPGRVADTREWVVRNLPYLIVYEVRESGPGEVMVLGVFHCREDRSS